MKQVTEALEYARGAIARAVDNANVPNELYDDFVEVDEPNQTFVKMRLDWELSNEVEDATSKKIAELMAQFMERDFINLLENGDKDSENSLLKALDGTVKRNKSVASVGIYHPYVTAYQVTRKGTTEFQLFVVLAVTWE